MLPSSDETTGKGHWQAQLKDLQKGLKDAVKAKDFATMAEAWRDLATCHEVLGDKKAADEARKKQNEVI